MVNCVAPDSFDFVAKVLVDIMIDAKKQAREVMENEC
jgi:hypothetical protein